MVPDIIAYNYPSSDRPRRAGRNRSTAPAIFEMKTIAACLLATTSPIFETEVKGGAYMYSVTLHLYRRALAGAIARGLSLHKRSRLHFFRGSRVEAARVAEDAKNHYESGGCSNGDGFSARHSSREYGYR